ncbi:MAG: hypothetical protein WAK17_04135 [Candidatus Nitrosopolaris sp.]
MKGAVAAGALVVLIKFRGRLIPFTYCLNGMGELYYVRSEKEDSQARLKKSRLIFLGSDI